MIRIINTSKCKINKWILKNKKMSININREFKKIIIYRINNNRSFNIKRKKSTINKTTFKKTLTKKTCKIWIIINKDSNKWLIKIHQIIHPISITIINNIRIFISPIYKSKIILIKHKFKWNIVIRIHLTNKRFKKKKKIIIKKIQMSKKILKVTLNNKNNLNIDQEYNQE